MSTKTPNADTLTKKIINKGPTAQSSEDVIKQAERLMLFTMLIAFLVGAIGVIGYSLTIPSIGYRLLYIGTLLALAAFITGFFTGTLFGMPKRNVADGSDYTLNNSLVEISEWLTKIIVGLGLVNLKQLPSYLLSLGTYVNGATGRTGSQTIEVYTMCVVVYFAVLGLYVGYNYMRLVLSQKYKAADDNMMRKELKQATEYAIEMKKAKEVAEQKQQSVLQTVVQKLNATSILTTEVSQEPYVEEMISKADAKLKKGYLFNKEDPHKGQWGKEAISNERKLSAEVKELNEGIYEISVKIVSTNDNNQLPDGEIVLFALHPTFQVPPHSHIFEPVKVEDGTAALTIFGYGSFTIGAFADRGNTELELDLAELPGVSEYFKNH